MSKNNITQASQLYSGKGRYAPLFGRNGRTGAEMTPIVKISMGIPIAKDPNGFIETQDLTAAGVASVATPATAVGAIAEAALAGILDIPRNVVAAWTGTAVLTVTGTDEYDNVMSEASASGTTFAGAKAFKTVTNVEVSADVTSLTVGTGDVLGLPYNLEHESDVLAFYAITIEEKLASVFVPGDATVATTTTGDVRGTVDPADVPDGSAEFWLWMKVKGTYSKNDLVGVTQA